MKLGVRVGAVAVLMMSSLTAGCGDSGESADGDRGGDLVFYLADVIDQLNLTRGGGNWYTTNAWEQYVDTFTYVDDSGELHPYLAESWTSNEDSTEFTLKLKEGITFSDGEPLDAEAAVTNIVNFAVGDPDNGEVPAVTLLASGFVGAEAISDYEFRVTYDIPKPDFFYSLSHHYAAVLSPKTLEFVGAEEGTVENFAATGPFVIESHTPGKELVLKKREDYDWGYGSAKHTGPAYLDTITYVEVADDGSRIGALESGQADIIHSPLAAEEQRLEDAGYQLIYAPQPGSVNGIALRANSEFLSDLKVRQALLHGLDAQEIVDTLYNDNWATAESILSDSTEYFTDLSDKLEYDSALANQLLDEAGWSKRDSDGYRVNADGDRLKLESAPLFALPEAAREHQLYAQQLKALGIELEIHNSDGSTYAEVLASNPIAFTDYQLAVFANGPTGWAYNSFNNAELSTSLNFIDDPELKQITDQLAVETDVDQRKLLFTQLQERVLDLALIVPIHVSYQTFAAVDSLKDADTSGDARIRLYDAYLAD